MAEENVFEGYEGLLRGVSKASEILKNSNIENLERLADGIAKSIKPSIAVEEIVGRQTQLLS